MVHAPAILSKLGCALAAIAGATIFWLIFTWNALWAFARSQTRLNRDMSLAASLLDWDVDWAFKRKPLVTFVMFIFLVYEMGIGIVQEFEEYKNKTSKQPLWNLLEVGVSFNIHVSISRSHASTRLRPRRVPRVPALLGTPAGPSWPVTARRREL